MESSPKARTDRSHYRPRAKHRPKPVKPLVVEELSTKPTVNDCSYVHDEPPVIETEWKRSSRQNKYSRLLMQADAAIASSEKRKLEGFTMQSHHRLEGPKSTDVQGLKFLEYRRQMDAQNIMCDLRNVNSQNVMRIPHPSPPPYQPGQRSHSRSRSRTPPKQQYECSGPFLSEAVTAAAPGLEQTRLPEKFHRWGSCNANRRANVIAQV